MSKGSNKILEHFKKLTASLEVNIHSNDPVNWNIQVTKSCCLNKSGTWYSIKSLADVEEIITLHIKGNQGVN